MENKTCFIIVGPTAVGKTSFAIQLAQHFTTQIISADSRQCFKELNIGVAKPSLQQLELVKHYFINSHSVCDEVNAKVFEKYSLQSAQKIFSKNDFAVMVGGTGLYIKTFCEGIDEIPSIDEEIKKQIISKFEKHGLSWLQNEIKNMDPLFFKKGEIQNPQRLLRALEVKLSTGKSIIEFQSGEKAERDFNIIKIGLELTKEDLHKNINQRVDEMIEQGLLQEVISLQSHKHLNALQTVGYKELFDHLTGNISLDKAIELIKQNTRRYAKRQITWFKKDEEINWFYPSEFKAVLHFLTKKNSIEK